MKILISIGKIELIYTKNSVSFHATVKERTEVITQSCIGDIFKTDLNHLARSPT